MNGKSTPMAFASLWQLLNISSDEALRLIGRSLPLGLFVQFNPPLLTYYYCNGYYFFPVSCCIWCADFIQPWKIYVLFPSVHKVQFGSILLLNLAARYRLSLLLVYHATDLIFIIIYPQPLNSSLLHFNACVLFSKFAPLIIYDPNL